MNDELLFNKYDIYGLVQAQTAAAKKRVQDIPANALLNASEHDLITSVVEEFWMNVPTINDEDIHIADAGETQVDVRHDPLRAVFDRSRPCLVPGNRTVISVPFTGDDGFFRVQPQTFTASPPRGQLGKNELLLTYVRTDHDGEALKREYQQEVKSIKDYLKWLSESAATFNNGLNALVTTAVRTRKERLLKDAGMTAAIGLPLKKRQGAPVTYSVPVKRRAPRFEQTTTAAFKPEPILAMEEYEEILRIMANMVHVMEHSPTAFITMGEEDLRTHFLVHLNGAYEGQATGETFNFQGKTDILIRAQGKNVFIAECKFWHGEKAFIETISQLLSYISWRDTKAAVLIFNRNADFSAVLATIAQAVPKHPNYKRDLGKTSETAFRYVFAQPNDANREMILTVLAFDIPTAPADAKTISAGRDKDASH